MMSNRRSARRIGGFHTDRTLSVWGCYVATTKCGMEERMASTHVDLSRAEWISGAPFYGPAAVYDGKDVVQLKILSDRRAAGGGIAWLGKFSPPPGKLIKIVATARSDEHVFNLEGGRSTKSGRPARSSGGYSLNPKGQPHR